MLFSVRAARVSPVLLLVSFKRQPQMSRYTAVHKVTGAKLVHYFTTRLKFTLENAEVRFPGYLQKNIRGPPDRLIEIIKAFYFSHLKRQLLFLLTAASLDDWRELAGRDGGNDNYVEGESGVLQLMAKLHFLTTSLCF